MSKQVNELKARVEWLENELSAKMDSADELYKVSLTDKKRSNNVISLIVPEEYGLCKIHKIDISQLKDFIELGLK